MKRLKLHLPPFAFRLLPFIFCLLLLLALLLRLAHLDQKVFWVDEVATVIRAVGYTKAEIVALLSNGQPHSPADLLAYQQLTPDRTWSDTFTALSRSPEHAPLYFLLVRFWMQIFGNSIAAIRSLSVCCGLLVLPAVYGFCRELFRAKSISWTAVLLIAISPFFIAYSQEARPYSLWLFTIVLSSWALLRAVRLPSRTSWAIYSGTLILSFYTSLLSLFVAIGHGLFVLTLGRSRSNPILRDYLLATGLALLAFSPWLWVIAQQQSALAANTTWMRTSINPLSIIAIWLYSFAVLFFDVPVVPTGWVAIVQAILAATVLSIMGYALYHLQKANLSRFDRRIPGFIFTLILPIPLILILLDLVFQGQASATPRYLIPSQFGVMLAIAFLSNSSDNSPPTSHTESGNPIRRLGKSRMSRILMLLFLISLSLISGWINLDRSPDYQKARNRFNPAVAAIVNQTEAPLLLAESTQTLDLLSLSHILQPTVQIQILPSDRLPTVIPSCQTTFLFTPSEPLLTMLRQFNNFEITEIYQPQLLTPEDIYLSLWQIRNKSTALCP